MLFSLALSPSSELEDSDTSKWTLLIVVTVPGDVTEMHRKKIDREIKWFCTLRSDD